MLLAVLDVAGGRFTPHLQHYVLPHRSSDVGCSLVPRPSYLREGLVLSACTCAKCNLEESGYVSRILSGRYLPCFFLLED